MKLNIKKIVVGPLLTNCYLLSAPNGEAILIDPGDDKKAIITELKKIKDLSLLYIFLTHAHFDHVLALAAIKKKYPKAVIYLEPEDKELLDNLAGQGNFIGQKLQNITLKTQSFEKDNLKFAGEKIQVIEMPGHTLGSVCYLIGHNLFSGDTLFYHAIGRTDLPTSNNDKMDESLEKLAKLAENIIVYPGHGPKTTIEEEKLNGYLK